MKQKIYLILLFVLVSILCIQCDKEPSTVKLVETKENQKEDETIEVDDENYEINYEIDYEINDEIDIVENNIDISQSIDAVVTEPKEYTPPVDSDKAIYISGLDLSKKTGAYYTTIKEEYINTTRFILYLDKDVEVPVNIIDLINYIMDIIEEETEYKFYAKWQDEYNPGVDNELDQYFKDAWVMKKVDPEHTKIGIIVTNDSLCGEYAIGAYGVVINPENTKLPDGGAYAIIHELLHVVMYRNGTSMNGAFDEGFTTYYTARIIEKDKKLNCTYDSYFQLGRYDVSISEDNAEQIYIMHEQGSDRYKLGFRLMHFLHEKYGDKAFKRLHEKVCERMDDDEYQASTELIAKVIKEELSEDFFIEFAKWLRLNMERFYDEDLSVYGDWRIIEGRLEKYYGDDSHVIIPDTVKNIGFEAFVNNIFIKTVEIPSTVTSIEQGAFYGCKNLKEIEIPDSVTNIYEVVFGACISLEKVKLSKRLVEIPQQLFSECTSLKEVILPNSIKKIGINAFDNCTSLKNIKLPDNLEEISSNSFFECTSLEKINIPDNVKTIGDWAFFGCSSLTEATLPKSLKKIDDCVFWKCTSLKSIQIPDGVTEIGSCAFNFTILSEVNIPEGVTMIGDYAFGQCKNLKIIIPESVKSIDKMAFYACDNLVIYGKKGSYAEEYAKMNYIRFEYINEE